MADSFKNLVTRLGKRGPHRVLTGDLSFAGLPGRVYVPEEGKGIAGVAFGHDWRVGVKGYHATCRHLASWGIAVAAPDTEKSVFANHRGFAADLETSLQILSGVRLGTGSVTVQPTKLYLAGHGMGASAAVLAATGRSPMKSQKGYRSEPNLAGVVAIYPADTSPSAYEAAKHVSAPGLVLDAGQFGVVNKGNAQRVAAHWKGEVIYRRLEDADPEGFNEKILGRLALGMGLPQFKKQEVARALLTGFILAGESSKYKAFRAPHEELAKTVTETQHDLFKSLPENAEASDLFDKLPL